MTCMWYCVMRMWYLCDVYVIQCDAYVIPVWCVCDTVWCVCDTVWCVCDTLWCVCDTLWCVCDTVWCVCETVWCVCETAWCVCDNVWWSLVCMNNINLLYYSVNVQEFKSAGMTRPNPRHIHMYPPTFTRHSPLPQPPTPPNPKPKKPQTPNTLSFSVFPLKSPCNPTYYLLHTHRKPIMYRTKCRAIFTISRDLVQLITWWCFVALWTSVWTWREFVWSRNETRAAGYCV